MCGDFLSDVRRNNGYLLSSLLFYTATQVYGCVQKVHQQSMLSSTLGMC